MYDKMNDYITTIFNVFVKVRDSALLQKDKKKQLIALTIYNYVKYLAQTQSISLKDIPTTEHISMIPFVEYINYHNIELYDFKKINMEDVDIAKKEDLEKFVLTHIYYITQSNSTI